MMSFDEWLMMTEDINTNDLTDDEYEMTWDNFISEYEKFLEEQEKGE